MLLLLTIALVLVGAVALVIGFVQDAMFPIYLSIGCSLLAAVVLVVFSRLSKARLEPAAGSVAIAGEPTGSLPLRPSAEFPISEYDDRRVAEIVPLLNDLDADELDLVREREAEGRNRTTILRRIDDLLDEREGVTGDEEELEEEEETLVGAAASFGRDDEDEDEDLEADAGEDLFPIADYDDLRPADILSLLDELTPDELEEVGDYEADGQNRAAVLDRIDELLDEAEAPAPVKKAAAKKVTAKKAPAKKAGAKKATAKKAAPAKAPAKKAPAKSAAGKKAGGKKAAAKKAPAKKAGAGKKAAAKRAR